MKRFKDRRKVLSLSLVGIAYAMIVLPLIISNVNKQQDLRGRAQVAQQSASQELSGQVVAQSTQAQCTAAGKVELGVSYTNADTKRAVDVTATDQKTGATVSLGTIAPEETKTGVIATNSTSTTNGTVTFTIAFTDTPNQKETKTATYESRTCEPASAEEVGIQADAPAVCGNVTTDVVLVIDRSGSMGQANKLVQAKNAAKNFIDVVAGQEATTRIALVSFSTTSTLNQSLSTDFSSLKSKVDSLTASGNTCQECGIAQANTEIATKGRAGVKKVVVMLTDGQANYIVGGRDQVSTEIGEAKALDAVKSGFAASKTVFFTIGLGEQTGQGDGRFFSPNYMRQVAELTGGKFYFPAPSELDGVYQEISRLIGKGLLGGFVFNDTNMNGTFDTNEPKLSGWTVEAKSGSSAKTAVSDTNGNYTLTGLCDGSYKLSQQMKSGWRQTLPSDPTGYAITISNATQLNDKHFGNTDKTRCNDGVDNDNNGFIDAADSTCHTDGNPKNPASYDPKKDGERGGNTCADSKDNNDNGLIDGADPICHVDGDPSKPWDPSLPETAAKTSLACSPSTITLSDFGKPMNVTLKSASGQALTNKTVTWSAQNSAIALSPLTTTTDSTGKASSSALVSLNHPTAFTTTITAKYAGDASNQAATCTIAASYSPSKTTMDITVFLDGIGNRGDNTNPTDHSLSNKNPKHPTIGADIQVFTLSNQLIASGTGTITYNPSTGNYRGNVPIQTGFPGGQYTMKVKADTYLRRQVNGVQNIVAGQENKISDIPLVAGDVNNDNKLNILDYNSILDCYSDLSAAANCSAAEKSVKTDLNDDNAVNQVDYNLFLREISTQPGQ